MITVRLGCPNTVMSERRLKVGRFDGILICTDLDGTLYRNDKTVSDENRAAIEYFKSEGGYFTFITGRMPKYAKDAYRAVMPNVAFGCVNGGGLYDGEGQKYIWKRDMPDGVLELVKCIYNSFDDVGIMVCCFEDTYFAKDNDTMVKFRAATGVPDLVKHYREVDEPIGKIIFGSDKDEEICAIEKMLRAHPLADGFEFVRSERTLFEILPKGVDKGLALLRLTDHLGVDPRRTIGIGDYDNDIGMFRRAGLSIAVANACDAAKAEADVITVSNEEHAIARVIYDLEQGIYSI